VTGEDGQGDNKSDFQSPSGRDKIAADAWFAGGADIPVGYTMTWNVIPLHTDTISSDPQAHPTRVTIAQGLANSEHTITLLCEEAEAAVIQSIRVYRPAH
jgi:hypothetical protein